MSRSGHERLPDGVPDLTGVRLAAACLLPAAPPLVLVLALLGGSPQPFDLDAAALAALVFLVSVALAVTLSWRLTSQIHRQQRSTRTSLQEQDRHAQQTLHDAAHIKDNFLSVMSHELRTPLTSVMGYAEILARGAHGPLTERQQRDVSRIQEAARVQLAIVTDLLDVSRLERGTLELEPRATAVAGAVERATTAIGPMAQLHRVVVRTNVPEHELPHVLADPDRLHQVLMNLLSNAVKFSSSGGTIHLGARRAEQRPGFWELYVADAGVGLAPDQLTRIWERFYQAESSATRRFGGTGLGLSLVKRICELHGGWASVVSGGIGCGATFSVFMPESDSPVNATDALAVADWSAAPGPMATPDTQDDRNEPASRQFTVRPKGVAAEVSPGSPLEVVGIASPTLQDRGNDGD